MNNRAVEEEDDVGPDFKIKVGDLDVGEESDEPHEPPAPPETKKTRLESRREKFEQAKARFEKEQQALKDLEVEEERKVIWALGENLLKLAKSDPSKIPAIARLFKEGKPSEYQLGVLKRNGWPV